MHSIMFFQPDFKESPYLQSGIHYVCEASGRVCEASRHVCEASVHVFEASRRVCEVSGCRLVRYPAICV